MYVYLCIFVCNIYICMYLMLLFCVYLLYTNYTYQNNIYILKYVNIYHMCTYIISCVYNIISYVYIHTYYIYIYTNIYIRIYIYIYTYIYIYIYIYTHTYVYIYICIHTHTQRGATGTPLPPTSPANVHKLYMCICETGMCNLCA